MAVEDIGACRLAWLIPRPLSRPAWAGKFDKRTGLGAQLIRLRWDNSQLCGALEKKVFYAIKRIDRKRIEDPQGLVSRLADSVLGHAGNEYGASGLQRDLAALEAR